jgi:quercetin dioxygenase-like cupin family protein
VPYLRRRDDAVFEPAAGPAGEPGVDVAPVVHLETVSVLRLRVTPGAGEADHVHDVDGYLVVLDGTVEVVVGGTVSAAPTGTVVYVPAGTVHGVRCSASDATGHDDRAGAAEVLELFVPGLRPGRPLSTPAAGAGPGGAGGSGRSFSTRIDVEGFTTGARAGGFAVQTLADAASGAPGCVLNAARVQPGGTGPAVHIHRFDQLFVVLQGELHVDVALDRVVARSHDVVVLPAGVPHTQWNEGSGTEIHLAVLVPPPGPGEPVTLPVRFEPAG